MSGDERLARARTLNRRAWHLRWRSRAASIDAANRVPRLGLDPHRYEDACALLQARRTLAWHSKWLGRFDEAEHHCSAALELVHRVDDADTTAEVLSTLAVLRYSQGHQERAGELVQQGLELLNTGSRTETRVDLLAANATLHRYIGDLAGANRFLGEALTLTEARGLAQEAARVHSNLSRLRFEDSGPEQAYQHARQSVDLSRASRNRIIEPYALELLGAACTALSRTGEAHRHLIEGERIGLATGDQRVVCQLLEQRARAHLADDNAEAALGACRRGAGIAELMNYPLWLRHFRRIESEAEERRGNTTAALAAYREYARLDAAIYRQEAGERLHRVQTELSAATDRGLAAERGRTELLEQKAYLETILESMSEGVLLMDPESRISAVNHRLYELMRIPHSIDLLGLDLTSAIALHGDLAQVDGALRERVIERRRALAAGQAPEGQVFRITTSLLDGSQLEFSRTPVGSDGAAVMTLRDVSADVARLGEQKLRLETTLANMSDGVMMLDANRTITALNAPLCEIFGVNPAEVSVGDTLRRLMASQASLLTLDEAAREAAVDDALVWAKQFFAEPGDVIRSRLRHGNRALEVTSVNLSDGSLVVTVHDATESERLRRSEKARAELAENLSHAQRLQALGELTGGVAHDFNNLLAVIMGNAELLRLRSTGNTESLDAVLSAAERGADLTRRLLAFSRKQSLRPQSLDLFGKVRDMEAMLCRTLGETVIVRVVPTSGLWRCVADPGHVENALLNLAVNARDAMPGGGTLTIECENVSLDNDYAAQHAEVSAGDYAVVSITDDGVGMTPQSAARAFEPFYSTKEVGEGSGLGLSMVYGFVKQSGGHVTLYSEPGIGTTARIYLPRCDDNDPIPAAPRPNVVVPRSGNGEHVVVVEDDAAVRRIVHRALSDLGYTVSAFPDGNAALAALASLQGIDALLTDVVLPGGLNGPEVARRFVADRPHLAVLYMSGYTRNTMEQHADLADDAEVLSKPFSTADLAEALGRRLEQAPKRRSPPE